MRKAAVRRGPALVIYVDGKEADRYNGGVYSGWYNEGFIAGWLYPHLSKDL